ncbi:hypothetical protein ID866_5636, partial [Astraeus odoratus]
SVHSSAEDAVKAATTSITPDKSGSELVIGSVSNTASISADTAAAAPDSEVGMVDLNLEDVKDSFKRFRILIVGRANSGKTTVLQRVCNTTDSPQVYDDQ